MSAPLRFTLKSGQRQRVDVSSLTPDRLEGLSLDEIGGIPLNVGNRLERVDDLFALEGIDSQSIRFENPQGKIDSVGKGMSQGLVEVLGDAGSYLGMEMRGGKVRVFGSVDAYAACEMRDGEIQIDGNAGDFLGAALPGDKKGMRGGYVFVKGAAGDRVGDHMRRGLILIEGEAGHYLGSRMTAGTVIVGGAVGTNPGYGMRRGTILLKRPITNLPPTFSDCGVHALGFLPLLFRGMQDFKGACTVELQRAFTRVHRYAGDQSTNGQGEILISATQ